MGPSRTALGDRDFMSAQTRPARQITPFIRHCVPTAVNRATEPRAMGIPAKGTRRL